MKSSIAVNLEYESEIVSSNNNTLITRAKNEEDRTKIKKIWEHVDSMINENLLMNN